MNAGFTFDRRRLVEYLDELGISDVYLSPILRRRPGSMHGYDVADHTRLNPELGGEEDFDGSAAALREHGHGPGAGRGAQPHGHRRPEQPPGGSTCWRTAPSRVYAGLLRHRLAPGRTATLRRTRCCCRSSGPVRHGPRSRASSSWPSRTARFLAVTTTSTVCRSRRDTYRASCDRRLESLAGAAGRGARARPGAAEHPDGAAAPAAAHRDRRRSRSSSAPREGGHQAPARRAGRDQPATSRDGHRRRPCERSTATRATRAASTGWTRCSTRRRTGWRSGGWRRRRSTTAASSTSTTWRPSAWSARRSSRRRTELVFRLLAEGKVTGLRIDHPDGLWDPAGYFRQLQEDYVAWPARGDRRAGAVARRGGGDAGAQPAARAAERPARRGRGRSTSSAEKILRRGRAAAGDWAVDGTTGYDFLNRGQRPVRRPPTAATRSTAIYARFVGDAAALRRPGQRGQEDDHAGLAGQRDQRAAPRSSTASPSATAATATSRSTA